MNLDLHGKTIPQLVTIIEDLEVKLDHHKRELGIHRDDSITAAFHRSWHLTGKEAALLAALYARKGALMSSDSLMDALYGDRFEMPEIKIVQVFVCKVRRKLRLHMNCDPIDTHWGRGFSLSTAGVEHCDEAVRVGQC